MRPCSKRDTCSTIGLLVTLAVTALLPSSAAAGRYTVVGCDGWVPYNHAPAFVAVYAACPGFAARNVGGNFSSPSGSQGGWSFNAPPGTYIVGLGISGDMRGFDGWQSALWTEGGGSPGGVYQLQACPWATCPGAISGLGTYNVPNATALRMRMRCGAGPCPNQALSGAIQINSASVYLEDVTAPTMRISGGALADGQWHGGSQAVTVDANDNTGIQAVRAYVAGTVRTEQPRPACAWGAWTPCANGGGALTVNTTVLGDGRYTLIVEVVDTGGLTASDTRTILVDNVAPSSPLEATVESNGRWMPANEFALRWTDPGQLNAPIVSAMYRLCPSDPKADSRPCTVGETSRTAGKGTTTIQVPAPGDWNARVWLRDAAGNQSEASSVLIEHLRFDSTPPTASIAPADADNPTRIDVVASDAISGIAGGEVEIQREDENLWRPLPTQVVASGLQAALDDSQFFDGSYRIRARVFDAAGNERSTQELTDGKPATVALPLRIKTRLAVGRVSHVRARGSRGGKARYRRVVNMRPRARYGRTIPLNGRLTTPGANPVAAGPVEVWEQIALPGAPWTRVANDHQLAHGPLRLQGPSRPEPADPVPLRRHGDDPPAHVDRAAAHPRIDLVRRRPAAAFVNGDDIIFRGHVRGRPLPPQGKLVELQVYTRRRWRTFAQPRANAETGRWTYRYRFESVRGVQRFRFRARVRKESGYPYELGTSSRISVRVRGV